MTDCLLTAFLCFTGVSFALAADSSLLWSYNSNAADGPDHWGGLCNGTKQSPININTSATQYNADLGTFNLVNYAQKPAGVNFTVINTGKTLKVKLPSDVYKVSGGGLTGTYITVQFHLHWGATSAQGSEHTLDGTQFAAELHFVSYNEKYANISEALGHSDGLAVLGVFIKAGETANAAYNKFSSSASSLIYAGNSTEIEAFELQFLLPADRTKYYRYSGSLTTPTCNEVVAWTVFKDPVITSEVQLAALRSLKMNSTNNIVMNFRPLQKLGNRTVQKSYKETTEPLTTGTAPVPTDKSKGISLKITNIVLLLLMLFAALFVR